jgi:hypothetical protein
MTPHFKRLYQFLYHMCGGAITRQVAVNVDDLQQFIQGVMGEECLLGDNLPVYRPGQLDRSPGSCFLTVGDRRHVVGHQPVSPLRQLANAHRGDHDQKLRQAVGPRESLLGGGLQLHREKGQLQSGAKRFLLGGVYKPKKDWPDECQFSFVTQSMPAKYRRVHDRCPIVLLDQGMIRGWVPVRATEIVASQFARPTLFTDLIVSDREDLERDRTRQEKGRLLDYDEPVADEKANPLNYEEAISD